MWVSAVIVPPIFEGTLGYLFGINGRFVKIVCGPTQRTFDHTDMNIQRNKCIYISLDMHIYRIDRRLYIYLIDMNFVSLYMRVYTNIHWVGPRTTSTNRP